MDGVMKKYFLSFLFIILCQTSLFGQLKYTFTQFGSETMDFLQQPAKWNGGDYLKLGIVGAGTLLLLETADQPIRDAVLRDQGHYRMSAPLVIGRIWGELYTPVFLFSGFAIHSLITNDMTTRKIGYEIGQASLYAGAVTYLLKIAISRSRPYTNEGHTAFHPFTTFFNTDHQSLPGGHNAAAFVLSTVLSRNANPVWLKIAAYTPAALTFVSRVYQDQHWTSDDFLGAAIGFFIATWVVDQHEGNSSAVGVSSLFPLAIRVTF
jgi:membrane-associated phospholipid phosphatase